MSKSLTAEQLRARASAGWAFTWDVKYMANEILGLRKLLQEAIEEPSEPMSLDLYNRIAEAIPSHQQTP
jgi:hypothetical protein